MCAEHGGDEQHRDDAVDDLRDLHAGDVGAVEREHQHIAGCGHSAAAEHDDPVDRLLAGVEAIGRRMLVADDAAASLEPFDVDLVRNIPGDPHQEDQHDAEREREAQIIVRVFRPLRPCRECLRARSAAAAAACRR